MHQNIYIHDYSKRYICKIYPRLCFLEPHSTRCDVSKIVIVSNSRACVATRYSKITPFNEFSVKSRNQNVAMSHRDENEHISSTVSIDENNDLACQQ